LSDPSSSPAHSTWELTRARAAGGGRRRSRGGQRWSRLRWSREARRRRRRPRSPRCPRRAACWRRRGAGRPMEAVAELAGDGGGGGAGGVGDGGGNARSR
jgi:hypothetical protein